MPYKEADLVPVAMIALAPSIIVAPPNSTCHSLREFVEASKKEPEGLISRRLAPAAPRISWRKCSKQSTARTCKWCPTKAATRGATAIMGGQVHATSEASIVSLPKVKGGKMKALAVTWTKRISVSPELTTATEHGCPDINIVHWASKRRALSPSAARGHHSSSLSRKSAHGSRPSSNFPA